MTDGVDAAVQRMEPAASQSMPDRATTDPQRRELRARDHAVLTPCERRDLLVDVVRSSFGPYAGLNLDGVGHRAMVARKM
jgi:hypothetical protein